MNYCPKCGNQISAEDIFCMKCGEKLDIQSNINAEKASKPHKLKKIMLCIIGVVALCVVAFMILFSTKKRHLIF